MTGICLAAGLLIAQLGNDITLRWTHSIQKTIWEEDYRRVGDALQLTEARIRGTGAGMEPPADAIYRDGAWHYTPNMPPLPSVSLRHSPYVFPYILCNAQDCRPLPNWLPSLPEEAVIELRPCR